MSPFHGNISSLFAPKSIAIIDASPHGEDPGSVVLANIVRAGFPGKIFLVHPTAEIIRGLPCLRKITDIPEEFLPLDLAVVCTSAQDFALHLRELGSIGTRAAIMVSPGFQEDGQQGTALKQTVKNLANKYNIALLGPNSLGTICIKNKLNTTFSPGDPIAGNVGYFSQSGALCVAMFNWARSHHFGFSSFASLGSKAVIDESDIIGYLGADPDTKVIAGYLESIESGPRFLRNAQIATRKKPVIILKAGRTPGGSRAASSHTGALAGEDSVYEAVFKQAGIIRANTTEDLFALAQAFASQPLPQGPGVAIVSNAGGPGILAADACERAGLTLARLSPQTIATIKELLPSHASLFNPVDVISNASPTQITETVRTVMADPAVHSLLLILVGTRLTPVGFMAKQVVKAAKEFDKPLITCLMGSTSIEQGKLVYASAGIPCYPFPENAIAVINTMYRQSLWKDSHMPVEINYRKDPLRAQKAMAEGRAKGEPTLTTFQAQALLQAYEVPLLETKLARTSDEAVQIARQMGLPVVLKIASPNIPHKTDVDGVILHLDTTEKIRAAFQEITSRAMRKQKDAHIAGCLVQRMAPQNSREVVISFKRDPRFGPMVLFSVGGLHLEIFKDISCRLAPLSLDDVNEMVRELKAFPLLAGTHGQKPVKFTAIEDILLIMSQLALDFPEIQEAECNPVLVNENGAVVADMRITLSQEAPGGS